MPVYAFSSLNHLGERFGTVTREFGGDAEAIAEARRAPHLYPLEVHRDGQSLTIVPLAPWRAEDWLRRVLV